MLIIKLFSYLLLATSLPQDGWVSVERPQKQPVEYPESERGVWPVFSKEFEGERVLVRFPEAPSYHYPKWENQKTMVAEAESEGTFYRLQVEAESGFDLDAILEQKIGRIERSEEGLIVQVERTAPDVADLLYRFQGKWVYERVILTSAHLYCLQTISQQLDQALSAPFFASFDLEIRVKNQNFQRPFPRGN